MRRNFPLQNRTHCKQRSRCDEYNALANSSEKLTMHRIEVERRVPADGVLQLTLPLGPGEANQLVKVTIEPVAQGQEMSCEEWSKWVRSMAGSWQGDFERPQSGFKDN
jgi:hypothetical protein